MNTLKSLVIVKSVAAAALLAAGVSAPSVSVASPDDGMICRGGYTASTGLPFKCTKVVLKQASLECTNTRFPTKVTRAPGVPGDTSGGRDICTRTGILVGSTDSLNGLVLNQDYAFAEVNPARIQSVRDAVERTEEQSLGVAAEAVDAQAGQPSVAVNGGFGSDDIARFTITLFTFPIPALSLSQPISPISPIRLP